MSISFIGGFPLWYKGTIDVNRHFCYTYSEIGWGHAPTHFKVVRGYPPFAGHGLLAKRRPWLIYALLIAHEDAFTVAAKGEGILSELPRDAL